MTWSDSFCAVWRTATSGSSPTCRTTCSRRWSPARRPTTISCRWRRRANAAEARPLLRRF